MIPKEEKKPILSIDDLLTELDSIYSDNALYVEDRYPSDKEYNEHIGKLKLIRHIKVLTGHKHDT